MHAKAKTFSHSGDLGDIIYFLPVMRSLGGGVLNITKLPPDSPVRTRQDLTQGGWEVLKDLLEAQPYVHKVMCEDQMASDCNGDDFRPLFLQAMKRDYMRARQLNLTTWQCIPHAVSPVCQEQAWLEVEPNRTARFVFNRTERFINPAFPWKSIYDILGKDAVFMGSESEYNRFINDVGPVPFVKTDNLKQAAEIIKGSECFIGNQSCLYAIAEGMKHNALLEVWLFNPNCIFKRDNVFHGVEYTSTMEAVKRIKEGDIRKK